jgi:hypothetical protein
MQLKVTVDFTFINANKCTIQVGTILTALLQNVPLTLYHQQGVQFARITKIEANGK